MGLQRRLIQGQYDRETAYYRATDVDDLLARIRAAVEAEREATVADTGNASGWVARITKYRAALDALLADGGE